MTLILQIENHEILDDGGPASVTVPESGLQAGRSAGMGWVLPDSSRHISGHHFDVFRQGADWFLRDVSTNGTFLQGQRYRLDGPHRLSHGERFQVGHYLIVVRLDQLAQPAPFPAYGGGGAQGLGTGGTGDDPWAVGSGMAMAPIDPLPPVGQTRRSDDFVHDFIGQSALSMAPLPPSAYAPPQAEPASQPAPPVPELPPSRFAPPRPGVAGAALPDGFTPGDTDPPRTPAPLSASQPGAPDPAAPVAPVAPPVPGPAPVSAAPSSPGAPAPGTDAGGFVRAFCRGAGLPAGLYDDVAGESLAHALGLALRHVSREIMLSLQDRAAAKHFARTGERTMRQATDNNPLKFLPEPGQAIETMFLRPRAGFQSGPEGLDEALKDLRLHQAALFAALQPALAQLLGDLAPEAVEAEADKVRMTANRKAKAWEIYVQRWDAKTAPHENGILDQFLAHFAEAYRAMITQAQTTPGGALVPPSGAGASSGIAAPAADTLAPASLSDPAG